MGSSVRRTPFLPLLLAALALFGPARAARSAPPADSLRKTVAVLYFVNNTGEQRYDPFGKGLASMMITDLADLDYVLLVEREHLESLIKEMELQQTEFFDQETALEIGQFLGAEYVVAGSMTALQPEIRLDTRVIQVETAEIVKAEQVTGKENELFQLQGKLADALMEGLDIALSPEAREQLRLTREANRIDDVETALAYSQALQYYDMEDYVSALERMNYVREHAPASRVAEMTYEMIERDLKEKGKREGKAKANNFLRKRIKKL